MNHIANMLESAAKVPAGMWWAFGVALGLSIVAILYLWRDERRGRA